MKLAELIKNIEVTKVQGSTDVDVRDVAYSTSSVESGGLFAALRGEKYDGHNFAGDAIERGASVVVSERVLDLGGRATGVVVKNSRKALAGISARFFGDPSRYMKVVGVTGTNGKTTITYLLEAIFKAAGMIPGVIGTVAYRYRDVVIPAPRTTPESSDLQRLLGEMKSAGVNACAMEVSSHALSQERVEGTSFDAAVFTNLTPEHLDYHLDMESYFAAKAVLFEKLLKRGGKSNAFAVINNDDEYGRELVLRCPVPVVLYGLGSKSDVHATDLSFDASGLRMQVRTPKGTFACSARLCGKFNALNILAAISVAFKFGIDPKIIQKALQSIESVPGRFESVENDRGVLALVDYAHTPDALGNCLSNARELVKKGGKLIAVFGCGGDRDRKKRPLMGEAAAKIADVAIVTSDNPRTENPDEIIREILPGVIKKMQPFMSDAGYAAIPDRRAAITEAVRLAKKGDVMVVAGKGHEDYQIIGTQKIHFDDREELRRLFQK